ncbi:hypothetical protein D3C85_844630 [compost metagenome]
MNVQHKSEKGFTIIEVVLVLAIAGLIFLMVFIALPALQRNQRDTARKNDVSTIASGVSAYTGNNRGDFPTADQLKSYVKDVSDNTDTDAITVGNAPTTDETITPDDAAIVITPASVCGASTGAGEGSEAGQVLKKGTSRQYTVVTKLEAGDGQYFCQNS